MTRAEHLTGLQAISLGSAALDVAGLVLLLVAFVRLGLAGARGLATTVIAALGLCLAAKASSLAMLGRMDVSSLVLLARSLEIAQVVGWAVALGALGAWFWRMKLGPLARPGVLSAWLAWVGLWKLALPLLPLVSGGRWMLPRFPGAEWITAGLELGTWAVALWLVLGARPWPASQRASSSSRPWSATWASWVGWSGPSAARRPAGGRGTF
jgi:hypothetical protein